MDAAPDDELPEAAPRLIVAPPRSRVRIAVGSVVVVLLVGLGASVVASMLAPRGASAVADGATTAALAVTGGVDATALTVHVLGEVADPGVYQLRAGARVLDAVAAAGGFAPDADLAAVNLASDLVDGQQLVVPAAGEAVSAAGTSASSSGKVNLNTADEATLETLPRVGPAMASRIIAYREANGGFRSVQDLLDVAGIGEKTFAALQPLVTV